VIFSYAMTGGTVVIFRRRGMPGRFLAPLYPWVPILSLGLEALYLGTIFILTGFVLYGMLQAYETVEVRSGER
jgi:hypothetical protein